MHFLFPILTLNSILYRKFWYFLIHISIFCSSFNGFKTMACNQDIETCSVFKEAYVDCQHLESFFVNGNSYSTFLEALRPLMKKMVMEFSLKSLVLELSYGQVVKLDLKPLDTLLFLRDVLQICGQKREEKTIMFSHVKGNYFIVKLFDSEGCEITHHSYQSDDGVCETKLSTPVSVGISRASDQTKKAGDERRDSAKIESPNKNCHSSSQPKRSSNVSTRKTRHSAEIKNAGDKRKILTKIENSNKTCCRSSSMCSPNGTEPMGSPNGHCKDEQKKSLEFSVVSRKKSYPCGFLYVGSNIGYQIPEDSIVTLRHNSKEWKVVYRKQNFSNGVIYGRFTCWEQVVTDIDIQDGDECHFRLVDKENRIFDFEVKRANGKVA